MRELNICDHTNLHLWGFNNEGGKGSLPTGAAMDVIKLLVCTDQLRYI